MSKTKYTEEALNDVYSEGRGERDKYWVTIIKRKIKELEDKNGITLLKELLKEKFADTK